jgi:hypothetical protein
VLQHPVPEKLLVHIGDITVSFALLESTIQSLVGSFIAEHQRIGQIITAELAFRNLRALTISLYKERHGEDTDFGALRELMKRAADLEEKRNQITHSVWAAGDTADTVTRFKMTAKERHGIRFQFQNVGEQDLAEVARALKQLAADVRGFGLRLIQNGKAVNNPGQKLW